MDGVKFDFKRFYFSFFILAIVIIGALISWNTYRNAKENAISSLIARTDTIARLIDEQDVSSLSFSEADLANPTYQTLKKHLTEARAANPDIRFIYIFAINQGRVRFVVDSEDESSKDYSPPGQPYPEAQQEVFEVFNTGESLVQDVYSDSYGTWVTGEAAIKDVAGKTKYVLGIDTEASEFVAKPYIEAAFPSMLSLILLFLALSVYIVRRKELEVIRTKTQFVSVASHELRAPLTGIRWSAENMLKQGGLAPDSVMMVNAIHDSSLHLLSVINDLLSISIADHDFIDKKAFSVLNVKTLVEKSITELTPTAASCRVTIAYETSQDELLVKGNEERLRNLFSNLISNAIKYSHENDTVQISIGPHSSFKGKTIRVAVRDNGIGIPKNDIKKVTQGFYRSQNAKIHTINGTGLGLYICFKIAQIHGGRIDIESLEGRGTMTILSLPFYEK